MCISFVGQDNHVYIIVIILVIIIIVVLTIVAMYCIPEGYVIQLNTKFNSKVQVSVFMG